MNNLQLSLEGVSCHLIPQKKVDYDLKFSWKETYSQFSSTSYIRLSSMNVPIMDMEDQRRGECTVRKMLCSDNKVTNGNYKYIPRRCQIMYRTWRIYFLKLKLIGYITYCNCNNFNAMLFLSNANAKIDYNYKLYPVYGLPYAHYFVSTLNLHTKLLFRFKILPLTACLGDRGLIYKAISNFRPFSLFFS